MPLTRLIILSTILPFVLIAYLAPASAAIAPPTPTPEDPGSATPDPIDKAEAVLEVHGLVKRGAVYVIPGLQKQVVGTHQEFDRMMGQVRDLSVAVGRLDAIRAEIKAGEQMLAEKESYLTFLHNHRRFSWQASDIHARIIVARRERDLIVQKLDRLRKSLPSQARERGIREQLAYATSNLNDQGNALRRAIREYHAGHTEASQIPEVAEALETIKRLKTARPRIGESSVVRRIEIRFGKIEKTLRRAG